jgi:hypothetical protein
VSDSYKASTLTEFLVRTLKNSGYFVECNVDVGHGIYGGTIKAEIVAHNSKRFPQGLIIKPYWQSVSGSADEKFPYMVLTARETYELPSVIVYAGDGYRQGAIDWLRNEVDEQLVAVLHAEEFAEWILRNKR